MNWHRVEDELPPLETAVLAVSSTEEFPNGTRFNVCELHSDGKWGDMYEWVGYSITHWTELSLPESTATLTAQRTGNQPTRPDESTS